MALILDIAHRREIPVLLASSILLLVSLNYFITTPGNVLASGVNTLTVFATIMCVYSIGLSSVRLFQYEYLVIKRREKEWQLSLWMFIFWIIVFILGMLPGYALLQSPPFSFILVNIIVTMDGTLWSICGLSIVCASARAFTGRSYETILMVIIMVLVLLWQIPGSLGSPFIAQLGYWINTAASVGGTRAVTITTAVAVLGVCVRTMFGREKGFFR